MADRAGRLHPRGRLEADRVLRGRPAGAVPPQGRPGRAEQPGREDAWQGAGTAGEAGRVAASPKGRDTASESGPGQAGHRRGPAAPAARGETAVVELLKP